MVAVGTRLLRASVAPKPRALHRSRTLTRRLSGWFAIIFWFAGPCRMSAHAQTLEPPRVLSLPEHRDMPCRIRDL
jgi:hypothetical protein